MTQHAASQGIIRQANSTGLGQPSAEPTGSSAIRTSYNVNMIENDSTAAAVAGKVIESVIPPLIPEPTALQIQESQIIDNILEDIDLHSPDEEECCNLYFEFKTSLHFYAGPYKSQFTKAIETVQSVVSRYMKDALVTFTAMGLKGTELNLYIEDTIYKDPTTGIIHRNLYDETVAKTSAFTKEAALSTVKSWLWQLDVLKNQPYAYYYRVYVYKSVVVTAAQRISSEVAALFTDCYIKKVFKEVLRDTKSEYEKPQSDGSLAISTFPSEFICCPCGSGKTTFAMNMCCGDSLMAYLLFLGPKYSEDMIKSINAPRIQEVYVPFVHISEVFAVVSHKELGKFAKPHLSEHYLLETRFQLFGLIVSFIQRLKNLNTLNPTKTWLELEADIGSINYKEMTGMEARKALEPIKKLYSLPITVFIDETNIYDEPSMARVNTLRIAFGFLGIVLVFVGTDVKAGKLSNSSQAYLPGNNVCRKIFNFLPPFDLPLFRTKCEKLKANYADNRQVQAFLDFLAAVRFNEQPLFVGSALKYLTEHVINPDQDALAYFTDVFAFVYGQFAARKQHKKELHRGQFHYSLLYSWAKYENEGKLELRPIGKLESSIHCHLGQLVGSPEHEDLPYFTPQVNDIQPFSSVFMSFEDAPLTGFILYGLGQKHPPFIARDRTELSVWGGMRIAYYGMAKEEAAMDGQPLGKLVNLATIVASRSNGPHGCNFSEFIKDFICQIVTDSVYEFDRFQFEGFDNEYWENFQIPFLAPMAITKWNKDAVKFLKEICNDEVNLGMTLPSINGKDIVVYHADTNDEPEMQRQRPDDRKLPRRAQPLLYTDVPKRIALVIECKPQNTPVNGKQIMESLQTKLKDDMYKDCRLFMIVVNEFVKNVRAYIKGVNFWKLTSEYVAAVAHGKLVRKFRLNLLPKSSGSRNNRTVILIDMKTVWTDCLDALARIAC